MKNERKIGVILSYIHLIIKNVISILYTPIMLRLLGQSEYGLYNLVASTVSYLGLLSFGFDGAYLRFYSQYKVKENEEKVASLNGMFLAVFCGIGILTLIVGSMLVTFSGSIFEKLSSHELHTAKILLVIMIINMALSFPMSVFSTYINANEKFFFQKMLNLIQTIVNPFVMIPVLLMGYKAVGLVVVTTLYIMVTYLINVVYCIRKLKMKIVFRNFEFKILKSISSFSFFVFLNSIVDEINWNVDKFLLGKYQGTVAVAIYGIGNQFSSYYRVFSTSISSVFTPLVNRTVALKENDNELTHIFARVGRIQFIILTLICSGFTFFGKAFIMFWAGKDYQESYVIAMWLLIPLTIPLIQNLGLEIQKAKNMHMFRSVIYFVIAILNVIISIPLCQRYSGLGCAVGTALSLIIGNGLCMNIYYHKKIGLDILYFWKEILKLVPALVVPFVLGWLVMKYIVMSSLIKLGLFIVIYILIYCISLWLIGLDSYEKKLIKDPVKKILRR